MGGGIILYGTNQTSISHSASYSSIITNMIFLMFTDQLFPNLKIWFNDSRESADDLPNPSRLKMSQLIILVSSYHLANLFYQNYPPKNPPHFGENLG